MAQTSSHVRRIATAGAYGAGSLTAVGAVLTGLVVGQAMRARRVIPMAEAPPPRCDGRYGTEHDGEPITITVLGDSTAAGYGADVARNTPGALIAAGLSEELRRPVTLHCLAVVGAESRTLGPQVERAIEIGPDVAIILVGGNDVTHRQPLNESVRHLVKAVRALKEAGAEVVVGTCPDLGTIQPIQPPLRWVARRSSRQLAAAQTVAVVQAGGRTVSLGDLLGPAFAAEPDRMFSWDRFHPSGDGYAVAAAALLTTVIAALTDEDHTSRSHLGRGEGVRSLPAAAIEAVERAGTELSAVQVAGRDHGPAGAWAQLRRRVWRRTEHPTDPSHVRLQQEQQEQQASEWSGT
ncbi:SGNH/GDSL hydrolase family protein [Planosporangium flavigriseum]|uniref:Lipase n=1 Tax=Planosporangium flavigriseum TaxID=373681 RepID=A0A8J3LJ89_9ACTN|nr:SGNH/GDSL hydrolase family protein [Planosporangium flavigriseum]NJC64885.1 SGNH/GDSL hydrolase family protein [Planosporangium flavigriseum]GIG72757.1 lipase [Planosporangium flavigriseum]